MSRFEFKIVGAMLLIAVIPLLTSFFLVGQVISVSESVADGQARQIRGPLSAAAETYRQLFASKKTEFGLRATLLSKDLLLRNHIVNHDAKAIRARLAELAKENEDISKLSYRPDDGQPIVVSSNTKLAKDARTLSIGASTGQPTDKLVATFVTSNLPFAEFQQLDEVRRELAGISDIRSELSRVYRVAFLSVFGAVLLATLGLGLLIARRTTRRVAVLAGATRRVAAGDLQAEVQIRAGDELGELSTSFNEMVRELRENKDRIGYLEKIGAWQEVARRLAHQIKNPLTPIQLSIQQLRSRYDGDDAEFLRLLTDAHEIISEEVDGLRRLVQAFSTFSKLPEVKPVKLELNAVVEDFIKSHSDLAERAQLHWEPRKESCFVRVDTMMMKHAIYNIIENAVQSRAESEKDIVVSIRARRLRHRPIATITIEDNGPGIAEDQAERIFDPYYTTKEQGTGLGLAIVKKIILEHQGTVSLSSSESGGCRFEISLPVSV